MPYANKVNGATVTGVENLGSNLDFFVFTGPVNILTNGTSLGNAAMTGNAVTQGYLDKLVEVVSLKGQPVITSTPTTADGLAYTFKFAVEHTGAWDATTLKASVIANHPQFMVANAALINVSVLTALS